MRSIGVGLVVCVGVVATAATSPIPEVCPVPTHDVGGFFAERETFSDYFWTVDAPAVTTVAFEIRTVEVPPIGCLVDEADDQAAAVQVILMVHHPDDAPEPGAADPDTEDAGPSERVSAVEVDPGTVVLLDAKGRELRPVAVDRLVLREPDVSGDAAGATTQLRLDFEVPLDIPGPVVLRIVGQDGPVDVVVEPDPA